MIDFASIKGRHRLEDVLTKRGVKLRRATGGWLAKCPIHQEAKGESFSVNERKQVWFCHGKCACGGDVLDLIEKMDGAADACAAAEILEGRPITDDERQSQSVPPPVAAVITSRELPNPPIFYLGKQRHMDQIAALRKLPHTAGLDLMQRAGCLRFCVAYEQPAYAVLDVVITCNIQVRRMDGKHWFDRAKVMGIKGNWAAWPVGLGAATELRLEDNLPVLLVEGTGDFMAAWTYAADLGNVLPIAMFGASQSIHPGALPLFCGRRVFILQQNDPAGAAAAARWNQQLKEAGSHPEIHTIPGEGNDLNDHLSVGGEVFWNRPS